jgi:nitrate/TMAO reductase-like tetraheme cytochrome c subunit
MSGITDEIARRILEQPFQRSGDFAELGVVVTTALAITVIALVIGSALGERRMSPTAASALGVLGLCVLPVFMMLFGAYTTVEGSKSIEFCHSCHSAMNLYVSDMEDPASESLAAVHYKQRWITQHECYRCHADYGVWGSADAKLRGFAHLYHWLISSKTALGEQQIRTYRRYRNQICLDCHAGGAAFLASGRGVHLMIARNLVERDPDTGAEVTSCMTCHSPAHPSLESWRSRG